MLGEKISFGRFLGMGFVTTVIGPALVFLAPFFLYRVFGSNLTLVSILGGVGIVTYAVGVYRIHARRVQQMSDTNG